MRTQARNRTADCWYLGALGVAMLLVSTLAVAEEPQPGPPPVADGLAAASTVQAHAAEPEKLRPRMLGSCDASSRVRLTAALRLAAQRVRDIPICAALFERLGADGVECLRLTLYQPVARGNGEGVCARGWGAVAFTRVKSPVTTLCPGFDRLTIEQAAVAVLHEALHFAGQSEWPLDQNAPDAQGINRTVRIACGL